MALIEWSSVHHSGGVGSDQYAPTSGITFDQINAWHKKRWEFKSSLGEYGGYNFSIARDGSLHQYRAIGEETAAQFGYNFNCVSTCVHGNFTLKNGVPVEKPTPAQVQTLRHIQMCLINGRPDLIPAKVIPGTVIRVPFRSIKPHRFFQQTECYGTALTDKWIESVVLSYYQEQISILQRTVDALIELLRSWRSSPVLGSVGDRACDGFIDFTSINGK